jgi:5-methylcytosine-specific restriction protein A
MTVALPILKPRIQQLPQRARLLNVENVNPRPAGRAWQATRLRLQVHRGSRCEKCGRLWMPELDQVDHRIPREQGGSDEDVNLQLLCDDCHEAKTKAEGQQRHYRR